jgi:hypothetical protein
MNVPQDPVMPQLRLALDEAAMAQVFADLLRPHGMRVEACSVERVKYRPGRNATLGYRLQLSDRQQRAVTQHVAARLCGDSGAARATRAGAAVLAASPAGPAVRWLPDLEMLTWWWPNDAKLRAPHVLACESRLRERVLPALFSVLGVPHGDDCKFDMAVVQYVPEHRLCARFDLQWQQGGEARRQRVYAKSSLEPDGATAHGLLVQLQASAAWRSGRLHTPRALLWQPETELYWQEGLPGVPWLDAGAATKAASAAALGAQLATLHGTAVQTVRALTRQGLQARLAEVIEGLAPVLGIDSVRRAAQAVSEGWQALDGWPLATLHGDFHGRNILVANQAGGPRVSLIDLDGIRRGPALLELGAWVADAMYGALLNGAPPLRDEASWGRLMDAYVEAGGARPDACALRWATAWSLLTQRTWRCVMNLRPGRFVLAPRLLALAAELAGAPLKETSPSC